MFLCSGELQNNISSVTCSTARTASPEQHSSGCHSTALVLPTYQTSSGNTTPSEFCHFSPAQRNSFFLSFFPKLQDYSSSTYSGNQYFCVKPPGSSNSLSCHISLVVSLSSVRMALECSNIHNFKQ